MITEKIKAEYERWLQFATDADVAAELKAMDEVAVEDAFYRDLAFGTGGCVAQSARVPIA